MTLVNRQTYTVTLPDGSQPGIISGSLTLDDSFVPYASATIVIPTPLNTSQLDPRSVGSVQPPRVVIGMTQEFAGSSMFAHLSALYPVTFATMSASFPSATFGNMTSLFTTVWNAGNIWSGRSAIQRSANLAIVDSTANDDGTTTLTLNSDEAYALQAAGTQLATWGLTVSTLSGLVEAAIAATMPATFKTTTDLSLASAISASPAQAVYSDNVWDALDTYVQLAAARLWNDENRLWHLDPNTVPLNPAATYSQGFESGADSWTNGTVVTTVAHTGSHSWELSSTNPSAPVQSKRTISGLTIGFTYTVTAWAINPSAASYNAFASLGVTGIGSSTEVGPLAATWTQVSYSFVATANSHEVVLTSSPS